MKPSRFLFASTLVAVTTICFLLAADPVAVSAASASSNGAEFVQRSCKTTSYPDVCYNSLVKYAPSVKRSPRQLAYAALKESAERARSVSSFVDHMTSSKPKPANSLISESDRSSSRNDSEGVIGDCIDNLKDSVDQLKKSLKEMDRLGRANSARFTWHLSNLQTWVSGALTDESTCADSLAQSPDPHSRPRLMAAIRKKVLNAAQATSNALALLNQLAQH